ncbi:MAG: hypothetical protein J6Y79_00300 [Paludibacteraceae bacterium]|nr:hypothetical protein [Paludibacteraceae bacterium]
MKTSKFCTEMIARHAELEMEKLNKMQEFVNDKLGGAEISQGKFDALVSYAYRLATRSIEGVDKAKALIEQVKSNPTGNFAAIFVEGATGNDVRWSKEEVSLFENH